MNFYATLPADARTLQQGDLLADVPFAYFSLSKAKVHLTSSESDTRDLSRDRAGVEFLVAKVIFSWGLVLSQTCDLQPTPEAGHSRKPVVVARVRALSELIKPSGSNLKAAVNDVKRAASPGATPTVFPLPMHTSASLELPKSGADLLDLQRFDRADLPTLMTLARLRLSPPALQALQERCAYCFGRFAAPDNLYYSEDEWAEVQRISRTQQN
ncbi:MAG: hypothetical protein ACLQVD_22495 [Capsulimonadaceae bacterium]